MFCQLWCHAGRPQVVGGADGFCWPTNNQRLRGVPPIWNEKNQNHYQRGCFCDNACGHLMLLFFALHQQNFESESREPPNRTSPLIWNRLAGLSRLAQTEMTKLDAVQMTKIAAFSKISPTFPNRTQRNQIGRDHAKVCNVDITDFSAWKNKKLKLFGHILGLTVLTR